jgi:hypothetical protein
LFHDFPPEVFLQRTDIIKSLLDLLEGGASSHQDNWDTTEIAQQALLVFLSKLQNVYRFLLHNGTKPNQMEKGDSTCDAYIEKTYPCNRLSRWETNQPTIPGGQNSLSCKATLGLILTKSIYLLQDTERIGLFV